MFTQESVVFIKGLGSDQGCQVVYALRDHLVLVLSLGVRDRVRG